MPRWEYCNVMSFARDVTDEELQELKDGGFPGEVTTEDHPLGGETAVVRLGKLRYFKLPRETTETFTDLGKVLTQLGVDGWEMVNATGGMGGITNFYFKRQLPDS